MPSPQSSELAARLVFLAGDHGTILLASARSEVDTGPLADEVRDAVNSAASHEPDGRTARQFSVLPGRGLLDDPETVRMAREAGAVVLVVRRGSTARSDLEECRRELDTAGIPLIAAVLVG